LIIILFSDKYFADCLQRKKTWTFENVDGFFTLRYAAKWFLNAVETVVLRYMERVNFVLQLMHEFICLKSLEIVFPCRLLCYPVILDILADFRCMTLQELTLTDIDDGGYEGSIENLQGLMTLRVSFRGHDGAFTPSLFPVRSASTLKTLIINDFTESHIDLNTFNSLTNLTSLGCERLAGSFCDIITKMDIELTSFTTAIGFGTYDSSPEILCELFSANSLKSLVHLKLTILTDLFPTPPPAILDEYLRNSASVIQCVLSNLRHLEKLEICSGLDISWCPGFAQLTALKSLKWEIQKTFLRRFIVVGYKQEPLKSNMIKDWKINLVSKIRKEFLSAFADFAEKPDVSIA